MRTTVDLPDELFRQLKIQAAQDGIRLKDLIRRYVEEGLRAGTMPSEQAPRRKRSELPVFRLTTGNAPPDLTHDELHRILDDEDAEVARARLD